MPYGTGNWGEDNKKRSLSRRAYFRNYSKHRYIEQHDEILLKAKLRHIQNIEKARARYKAYYYVKIPDGKICDNCGVFLATHRHHPDYSKPLEVRFLCVGCHRKTVKGGG